MIKRIPDLIIATVVFFLLGSVSFAAYSDQARTLAVFYPDLDEPYRSVMNSIVEGIRGQAKLTLKLFPLKQDTNFASLKEMIVKDDVIAIIALGRQGLMAAKEVHGAKPVVAGALFINPDASDMRVGGISLAPNPVLFFDKLLAIVPPIKRVHVVYNPANSQWLVDIAQKSAKEHGLSLLAYAAEGIKESALIYRDILNKGQPREDAIWLLPDAAVVDEKVILPLLLKESWEREIAIFSSNPTHTKRGTLFAIFPENHAMGASLAKMAEGYLAEEADHKVGVVPLWDVQAALNIRTAAHLGLNLSVDKQRDFSLIFPTQ